MNGGKFYDPGRMHMRCRDIYFLNLPEGIKMQSEVLERERARRVLQDSVVSRNTARMQESIQPQRPLAHSGLFGRVAWFLRKKVFILSRLCLGDALAAAQHAWTLAMMEQATKRALGVGMGDYAVLIENGTLSNDTIRAIGNDKSASGGKVSSAG